MGRTPKATVYQTSSTPKDLAVYKNESIQIRRQTTWNTNTNTNKKTEKGKETIHIAGKPTTRTIRKQPTKGSKRTRVGQQKACKRGGKNPQRGMGA
jgi:hypothetical protein